MGQIKFIGGIMLFGLFVLAVLSYAVWYASDNNAVVDISSDSDLNTLKTNINSNLDTIRINTTSSSQSFAESDIDIGSETTKTGGVFKALLTSTITPITSSIGAINTHLFGGKGNPRGFGVIMTTLITFLSIVALLYIWKTWKGGSPD